MASTHPKIGPKQLALVKRDGPAAVRWQRRAGLAEARSRCVAMVIAGLAPFFGWLMLDWTPTAMLLFLAVDVLAVLAGDLLKLLIAHRAVRHAHAEDHRTQQVLGIIGGLRDRTGTYTEHGRGVQPAALFAMAVLLAAVSMMGIGAGLDALGLERIALEEQRGFAWFAAGSVLLHVLPAGLRAFSARRRGDAEDAPALFLDSGGVIGLGVGMLVLIWLPLNFGAVGAVLLLAALFLFRLAFGLFALWYIPRVSRDLEDYLRDPEGYLACAGVALAGRR